MRKIMFTILHDLFHKQAYTYPNPYKRPKEEKDYCYQNELLKQYGKCTTLHMPLPKWLFISDTHNIFRTEELNNVNLSMYQSVILLGDHSMTDLDKISKSVPKDIPIYGVLGNHDEKHQYELFNRFSKRQIQHIGNNVTDIDGIKVAAFDGAFRYKPVESLCMYTPKEMYEIAENLAPAQIVFAHSNPFLYETEDDVHGGMKAITQYIYKNHIPYLFHGHTHFPEEYTLRNNTTCNCVYHLYSTFEHIPHL